MRLPITEQFLWNVYKFFEITGDILEPPHIFKLKGFRDASSSLGTDYWKAINKKKQKKHFGQFINHLKSRGYIKIVNLHEKKGILLTPKGKTKALKVDIGFVEKKKRKDKKWIMIMYDIPERKKRERNILRRSLQQLGYESLQRSIWVCPYDVFEKTEEFIRVYALDSFVRVFLIEEVSI